MTNKELVEIFPECEFIHKNDIISLVNRCFEEPKRYSEISNIVYEYCERLYVEPNYDNDKENWKKWNNYFYGDYNKETKEYIHLFRDWLEYIELEFRKRNPCGRSYEEACKIVADKWCELLFEWHLQDNGALNEDHGGGFWACALGTVLGNEAKEKISENSKKNAHEYIYKHYINDCLWKFDNGDSWSCELSVDYHPNTPLATILKKSGIEERYIDSICPWKTRILIDKKDNSVIYATYGKREYI